MILLVLYASKTGSIGDNSSNFDTNDDLFKSNSQTAFQCHT